MPNSGEYALTIAERAAFGQAIEQHQARLLSILENRIDPRVRPLMSAGDVLNEACITAQRRWRAFSALEDSGKVFPWLYQIAMDRLKDMYRKETAQRRDVRRNLPWPERSSVQLANGLWGSTTTPSKALARKDILDLIVSFLDQLRPRDRDILTMRHFDELTFAEAADVLGITENNASVRYIRAFQRLKDLWARLGPDLEDRNERP